MSTPINNGGFAFACDSENQSRQEGMSLRDWFAGQALIGLMSSRLTPALSVLEFAMSSYEIADAMLKEREVAP